MKNDTKKWFKPKKYGWGWTPSAWQGWAATIGYGLYVGLLTVSYTKAINQDELVESGVGLYLMALYFGGLLAGMTSLVLLALYKGGSPSSKGARYFKK